MFQLSARPAMARAWRRDLVNTDSLFLGALMLVACIGVGLLVGAALHRRVHAAQIADIDGDITALRAKLREVRDEAPPPASDSPAKG
jgi:hypothetical protein